MNRVRIRENAFTGIQGYVDHFVIKNQKIPAMHVQRSRMDKDHGHEYQAMYEDYLLSVPTPIGVIKVSLREFIYDNPRTHVYQPERDYNES